MTRSGQKNTKNMPSMLSGVNKTSRKYIIMHIKYVTFFPACRYSKSQVISAVKLIIPVGFHYVDVKINTIKNSFNTSIYIYSLMNVNSGVISYLSHPIKGHSVVRVSAHSPISIA